MAQKSGYQNDGETEPNEAATDEPTKLSETERQTLLDAEVQRYVVRGFCVISRTPTKAQLVRPKEFSLGWAMAWFLLFGVGLLVYVFYYLSKQDTTVYLTVDDTGRISMRAAGDPRPLTGNGPGGCPQCGRRSAPGRRFCKVCGAEMTAG